MIGALLFFIIFINCFSGLFLTIIPEDTIDKDLYLILGLKLECTHKEIKKAFRNLAQIHHPDKHLKNKEANEEIFRDIALAYEILSDPLQREEYDASRAVRVSEAKNKKQQYQYQDYQREQQQQQQRKHELHESSQQHHDHYGASYDSQERANVINGRVYEDYQNRYGGSHGSYYHAKKDFDVDLEDLDIQSGYFKPVQSGPFFGSGTVMFPYSPIMTTADRSHFAFLDMHCSFGVYRGDPDVFMSHLMAQESPDMSTLAVETIFRTIGEQSLQGQCFAGLDDSGIFWVYQGHPDAFNTKPLWHSEFSKERSKYSSSFRRFYLELLPSGEFAVRSLVAGNAYGECIWSTTSCNFFFAVLKEVGGEVKAVLNSIQTRILAVI